MIDATLPKPGKRGVPTHGSIRANVAVWIEGKTHFFLCDVCGHETTVEEPRDASWDEVRLISTGLKEEGWRLTKKRGSQWEALCPDCAPHSGYAMGPEAFD
jgi:hypothetical protein